MMSRIKTLSSVFLLERITEKDINYFKPPDQLLSENKTLVYLSKLTISEFNEVHFRKWILQNWHFSRTWKIIKDSLKHTGIRSDDENNIKEAKKSIKVLNIPCTDNNNEMDMNLTSGYSINILGEKTYGLSDENEVIEVPLEPLKLLEIERSEIGPSFVDSFPVLTIRKLKDLELPILISMFPSGKHAYEKHW